MPLVVTPLECCQDLPHQKMIEFLGYHGIVCMVLAFSCFDRTSAGDRVMDTVPQHIHTSSSMALLGNEISQSYCLSLDGALLVVLTLVFS